MKVLHVCSNRKKHAIIPKVDILLWAASVCAYRKLGYTTKLYCSQDDIPFLLQNHLYELYDEIDNETLTNNEQLSLINENIFWACRKFEAIRHEFQLGNDFFYSDTDILIFSPLNFHCDLMVWSPEHKVPNATIYIDWKYISKPNNYILPQWLKNTDDAYNAGILYFKNQNLYLNYLNEVYQFIIDNPGEIDRSEFLGINDYNIINIPMCNAEQRILKGWAQDRNLVVSMVMSQKLKGLSRYGNHYFWYRVVWKTQNVGYDLTYVNMINICKQLVKEYNLTYFVNEKYSFVKYE